MLKMNYHILKKLRLVFMSTLLMTLLFVSSVFATEPKDQALSMVPRGKISETHGRDYIIKTKAGSKIDIEFDLEGKLKQATGKNLNMGDELEPGDGLMSLSSVARQLDQLGQKPSGHWKLEKDKHLGWIYDLNSQFILSAHTGKVLKKIPNTSENIVEDTSQAHH